MKDKLGITLIITLTICLSFVCASGALAQTYNIYFGDLHTHTGYSDGSGTPAEAFQHAKSSGQADFMAVTDHAPSVNPKEWKDTVAQADIFTESTFVAIAGFEYCKDWGHMCIFNTALSNPRTTDPSKYYDKLVALPGSIGQWNHPTWSCGDNFDGFAYYSAARDSRMGLIEVNNWGDRYEANYPLALDMGWHVSPAANSDAHEANWITGWELRTAVLATSLTRDNIYDAILNNRTYATEDRNLRISYTLNGNVLGSIIPATSTMNIVVHAEDPDTSSGDTIIRIEIISDGGTVVASQDYSAYSVDFQTTLTSTTSKYYYVKVTKAQNKFAWTAPVWITR